MKPRGFSKGIAGGWPFLITMATLVTVSVANAAAAGDGNDYAHHKWYVSATAAAGGDGSANRAIQQFGPSPAGIWPRRYDHSPTVTH